MGQCELIYHLVKSIAIISNVISGVARVQLPRDNLAYSIEIRDKCAEKDFWGRKSGIRVLGLALIILL